MTITYIFGNGFDCHLGLDSRYSDFLEVYAEPNDNDSETIKKFKDYLSTKKGRKLWSDAEFAMGHDLSRYSDDTIAEYIECIEDFEINMVEHLKEQQGKCDYSEKDLIKKKFDDFVINSYQDVLLKRGSEFNFNIKEQNIYQFITFNYTNVIDNILSCCKDKNPIRIRRINTVGYSDQYGLIHHVHGTLAEQIIMGVNDESQLDTSGGVSISERLKWIFIKNRQNTDSGNRWNIPTANAIKASNIIFAFGLSYGATDKLWLSKILDWLKADSSHKFIAFVRKKNEKYNSTLPWREIEFEYDKKTEILQKIGASDDDIAKLLNQVYIIVDTKRLDLKDVICKKEELKIPNQKTAIQITDEVAMQVQKTREEISKANENSQILNVPLYI